MPQHLKKPMKCGKSERGNPPFDFRFLCVTPHARSPAGPLWRFHPPLPAGRNPHMEPAHDNLMLIPAVAALRMNPRMAGLAQRHKVLLVMRPALCQWQPVVYLLHRPQQSFLLALLTERILCSVAVTDTLPRPAVPTAYSRIAVSSVSLALLSPPHGIKKAPAGETPTKAACLYAVFDDNSIPRHTANILHGITHVRPRLVFPRQISCPYRHWQGNGMLRIPFPPSVPTAPS